MYDELLVNVFVFKGQGVTLTELVVLAHCGPLQCIPTKFRGFDSYSSIKPEMKGVL